MDDGDADAPEILAGDEGPGAVDGIDDKDGLADEAAFVVVGLLRKPAIVRPCSEQPPLEDVVGGEVGPLTGERPSFFQRTSSVLRK